MNMGNSTAFRGFVVALVCAATASLHGQSFSLSWDFGLDGTGTATQGAATAHIGTAIAYYTGYTGTNQFIDATGIGAGNVSWQGSTSSTVGPQGWSLDAADTIGSPNYPMDAWIFTGAGHTQIAPNNGVSFVQDSGAYIVGGSDSSPVWGTGTDNTGAAFLVFDIPTLESYDSSAYALSISSVNFQAGAHGSLGNWGPSIMGMYLWDGSNLVLLGSYNENFTDVHTTYYLPNGNPFILDPNYWNTFDPVRFGYYDLITAGYTLTPGTDYQLLFFAGWDTGQQAGIPNSFILNDMEISFSSTKLRKGGSPSPSSANGTPEPAAGILALFGLGLLAFRRRRR